MQILIAFDHAKAIKARIEGPTRAQVAKARRTHAALVAAADGYYAAAASATRESDIERFEEAGWAASEQAYDLACDFRPYGVELEG